jgi:hypothetical protein
MKEPDVMEVVTALVVIVFLLICALLDRRSDA